MTEVLIGFAAMFALMAIRVPIALAMGAIGFIGVGLMRSWPAAIASTANEFTDIGAYTLSVVPLFILMGNFVTRAGMSSELYRLAYTFLGHRRGGLAMSTIAACGGFSAICGSSIATAATMARVSMPEMRRFGYDEAFAAGTIAAGGTLGILIPPSVIMVLYGIMTETSIGAMFAAGFLPGLLAIGLYLLTVAVLTARKPSLGPPGERSTGAERLAALKSMWAVIALFLLVIGGMYGGFFTPTEGAGVGAFGGFLFALFRGQLSLKVLYEVLADTAQTSAMLFMILIGASIFSNFVNFTTLPGDLQGFVQQFDIAPLTVVILICAIYVVLGSAMEELSMMLLTVPIFFPLVVGLGFDPVWFGILVVCVISIGMISPPVGMNIFVIASVVPGLATTRIWAGVTPFIVADLVRLAILIAFPWISLVLPRWLGL